MNKKTLSWLVIVLIIMQIPIFLFLMNAKNIAFNSNFYEKEYAKYNPKIDNRTEITNNLIYFLENKESDQSYITEFEQDEISHLIDVKILMQKSLFVLYSTTILIILLFISLFFINKKKFLKKLSIPLISGGILTLTLTFIIYLLSKNFSSLFTKFHNLFFKVGTWSFPAESKLITLLPEEFWISALNKIIINTIVSANILILVGILILWRKNIISKFNKSRSYYRTK